VDSWKERAAAHLEAQREEVANLSRKIHANPELAYEEHLASSSLAGFLMRQGFSVEIGAGDLATAFVASLGEKVSGPTVAFLAEYDALPTIGHGCGHNLIGTAAAAAAAAVANSASHLPGQLQVVGCPAEEYTAGQAGKLRLLDAGVLSGIDACLMFHPWTETGVARSDLGFVVVDITFTGKPAHASADPWNGLNALDAAVLTYNSISMLRQQTKPDARIHCVITRGGEAVNVIPSEASLRCMIRSADDSYLKLLACRIEDCARASALGTGTEAGIDELTHVQPSRFNATLYGVVARNAESLGQPCREIPFWNASSDFGNVSQRMPAVCLLVKTHSPGIAWHSKEVAQGAVSDDAHAAMLVAAKIMAWSAIDLLTDPALVERSKAPGDY
jgi:amidohydrolase